MIKIKLILMLFFVFGAYPITKYYYEPIYLVSESNDVLQRWNDWYLIMIFIGFSIPIEILISLFPKELKFEKLILNGSYYLFIGNIVDRVLFDINYFNTNDYLTIILALIISTYKYYNER